MKKYPIPKYLMETSTLKVEGQPYCYLWRTDDCPFRDKFKECMILWKLTSIDPYCESGSEPPKDCPLEDAE